MRYIVVGLIICYISSVTLALQILNQDLGSFHTHAKVGTLPLKYDPLTEQDQVASQRVADFLNLSHIPQLPQIWKINHLDPVGFDINILKLKGQVFLKNIQVIGLKQTKVNNVELRLNNLRSDLNISFPQLHIELDIKLQAHVSFVPIVLGFHLSANLAGLNIAVSTGSVQTLSEIRPLGNVLQLNSAEKQTDVENVKVNITHIVLGGPEDQFNPDIAQLFVTPKGEGGDLYYYLLNFTLKKINLLLEEVPADIFEKFLWPIYGH